MSRLTAPLARLSVRVRVTLAFAFVMAVLLSAMGLFLYLRFGAELGSSVDRGLRSRAGDVAALVKQADSGLSQAGRSPLTEQGESFAQILEPTGQVLDASPPLRHSPLLTPAEVRALGDGTRVIDRRRSPFGPHPVRLLATSVKAQGGDVVVVVGASLEPRNVALGDVGGLLLLGGPVMLVLASLAGYAAAAGALRPVESMRQRAQEIQAARPGRRLPVPRSNDEIARLGETLNTMLERLEAALARERTFVADASHELRSPLTVLKAELELALERAGSAEEFREALISATEETDRLAQLAEDLLVIARTQDGGLPVRTSSFDVGELMAGVRHRFAARAEQRATTISVDSPDGVTITADRLRLEQALGNLVDNALRHGDGGVELSMRATGRGGVELHVRDHGAGFPDAFLGRAFERFTVADPARGPRGAGLGLAIVAAIADAHGGSAGAGNTEDGGADVWLELPEASVQD
jgi:signal transduction histidine kinase